MILRSYKKNIAEGLGFVIFSIVFGVIVRAIYFFTFSNTSIHSENTLNGYLWEPIAPLFANPFVSLLSAVASLAVIILILAHINTKYVLIRHKTSLHLAFCILLFSSLPDMVFMNVGYISVIFILIAISRMFGSYSVVKKSKSALEVGFILALGSLFAPGLLMFLPVFWIGLGMMRSFNFRAFLASLFSILCVYFPVYAYFLLANRTDMFLYPFMSGNDQMLSQLPISHFQFVDWLILGFTVFLLVVIFIYNYMTNYKDKIRIRALISSLNVIVLYSLIIFLLVNVNVASNLYILLAVFTLLLAHFFVLAQEKWIVYLFYLSLLMYFISIALTFVPIV